MKIRVSGRAWPVVLFVVASVLGCWGAFAGEKTVSMLPGENWSQSVLVSDKGRVPYCDAPVEATISTSAAFARAT